MRGDAALFEAGQRFAWWARTQRPKHTEKWLQSELDISETKAERALMGDISKDTLERALRKWKWAIAAIVLEPYCGRLAYHHELERLERIENEIAALRAERVQMADRVDRTLVVLESDRMDDVAQRQIGASREEIPPARKAVKP